MHGAREDSILESQAWNYLLGEEGNPGERLLWAAQYNKPDLVRSLLSSDPALVQHADSDGYTALHRAAYSDHYEVLELLLEEGGADPLATTEDGWTALHSAARWNCARCVERLLLVVPVNTLTRNRLGHFLCLFTYVMKIQRKARLLGVP